MTASDEERFEVLYPKYSTKRVVTLQEKVLVDPTYSILPIIIFLILLEHIVYSGSMYPVAEYVENSWN